MLIILLISLAVISFGLTAVLREIALKQKVLDIPTERSSHDIPTPRGGGFAVLISWYLGITILFLIGLLEKDLFLALVTGVLLAVVSLLDDLFSIKPAVRLIIQLITAAGALFFVRGFSTIFFFGNEINSPFILYPVTILGIIWFINLFNFLDGIDAYASLEAIFIAAGIFIFIQDPILLVLISSILGFLYWNWPKAKIFMGDVGSTQLGFVIIILGIYYHNTTDFKIIYWIMLSSLFWFDATLTLIRRRINREKISRAHKKHAYQRIVQAGFSHLKTDIYAIFINILILFIVIISYHFKIMIIPGFVLMILLLIGITWMVDKKFPFQKIG